MTLSTGTKVALGLAAAGLVGGVAYYGLDRKKKKTKAQEQLEGAIAGIPPGIIGEGTIQLDPDKPPIVLTRDEPLGGWQHRFDQKIDPAITRCRGTEVITTFGETQLCLLATIFPEAIPWGGSEKEYKPWMFQARDAVRDRLRAEVQAFLNVPGGTQSWQFLIWLMFNRFYIPCVQEMGNDVDAITHCVASQVFRDWDWLSWPPPVDADNWQHEAWQITRGLVLQRLNAPTPSGGWGGLVVT